MEDSKKEVEQMKVAESLSSSADGGPRLVEDEENTPEPEIVKSDEGIIAVRVPVIVSPIKSTRNLDVQTMAENEPSSSSRSERHEGTASSSFRPVQLEKLIVIREDTDDEPLDFSKKSSSSTTETFYSTEKQPVAEKEDMLVLPEKIDLTPLAESSQPEGQSRRTFEQESKKSFRSPNINKMNENLDKFKRKINEEISTDPKAKIRRVSDSASSRKTDENPRLPADSDCTETVSADYLSFGPSTSSGSNYGHGSKAILKPSTRHSRKSPLICDQCSKGFLSKYNFERHYRSHTGEKPFECVICHRKFADQSRFKEHTLRIHTKERSHPCDACGKLFFTKSDVNQHYSRIHIGAKPFPCTKCEKSFATKYVLERHNRTHTGERPYVCETCGKAYTSKNILNYHKKTHHKSKET